MLGFFLQKSQSAVSAGALFRAATSVEIIPWGLPSKFNTGIGVPEAGAAGSAVGRSGSRQDDAFRRSYSNSERDLRSDGDERLAESIDSLYLRNW